MARVRTRSIARSVVILACISASCGDLGDRDVSTTAPDETDQTETTETTEPAVASTEPPDDTTTTTTTTAAAAPDEPAEPRTASFRGVTEDTITIAVSYLDFGTLQELNLIDYSWGDQELVYRTLIDDINARGGIHGRQVEVALYESYSPIDRDEADADCVAMTEDNDVFLVLGGFLGPTDPINGCIVDLNQTALVGGTLLPDLVASARAPWWDFRPEEEDQARAFFRLLAQTGRTDGAKVFVVTLTGGEELAADVVMPAMQEVGIEVVGEAVLDVPDNDVPAQDQRMQVISELIAESGADTIVLPGGVSAIIRGLGVVGVADDYDIWAVNRDTLNNLGESVDPGDARGALTIDRLTDAETWDEPSMVACRQLVVDANPEIAAEVRPPDEVEVGQDAWFLAIHSYCSRTALMEQLLLAAGPNPTYETLQAGADALGEFSLPGVPNASLGPGKQGADDSFRLSAFDPDAGGDRGGLVPVTEIIDVT